MEIAGFVVAVLAVAASGFSLWYARAANITSDKALDLQAGIDAREREFRDVVWKGSYETAEDNSVVFALTNVGLTPAKQVTLVFTHNQERRAHSLGDIAVNGTATATFTTEMTGGLAVELMLFTDPPFFVHWSSPAGQVEEYEYKGRPRQPGM
ncbi:hypothetical protein PTQ19_10320 [Microbacterium esteraromaticum]|uniref:hypothetical protein n=1 Tax=Microbacterium esteraromaticum TaxID=57043 RepID=UPI00236799F3|nr:hypothetical protein [Microbacterium esteraromaticum]WDH77916.1 hypothetical protein PTQ19_10320 [Microbacterium esteraromaticum]